MNIPNTASLLVAALILSAGCGTKESISPAAETFVPTLVPITNMVLIKPGTFLRQKYRITLTNDYWLGRFEVTQEEFLSLMGRNPSHFRSVTNHPVEKLSYLDAAAYCSALTTRENQQGRLPSGYQYRLPTEAEWEYACRAGTTNFFSFGDDRALASQYAWTAEISESKTHPIGLKLPNPWGLHDMHGNVWEWVSDWFTNYPAADLVDPAGPPQGRFKIFRGGGWNQDAEFARSANRFMMSATNGIHFVGFRVALSRGPSY